MKVLVVVDVGVELCQSGVGGGEIVWDSIKIFFLFVDVSKHCPISY
ncbi:hypothetical protein Leryth_005199 [Lithospermum erythrorhizon]|nr:hypothetical protein Leryth_005199 [Lithospermum erythrorhizon]